MNERERERQGGRVGEGWRAVISYVSPALACSTISWRRMTSNDLGKEPAGISLEVSCILALCQSANLLSCRSKAHFVLLRHGVPTQMVGCNSKLYPKTECQCKYQQRQDMFNFKVLERGDKVAILGPPNLCVFELLLNIFDNRSTF